HTYTLSLHDALPISIHLLAGLLKLDDGEITLDGYSAAKNPLEVKRRMGLVPQELAIYNLLTARENVTFFAKLYGLRGNTLKERVDRKSTRLNSSHLV